jgi:hypothetical protein
VRKLSTFSFRGDSNGKHILLPGAAQLHLPPIGRIRDRVVARVDRCSRRCNPEMHKTLGLQYPKKNTFSEKACPSPVRVASVTDTLNLHYANEAPALTSKIKTITADR